jgi:hypothetical protein
VGNLLINKTSRKHHLYYSDLAKRVSDDEIHDFLTKNNLDIKVLRKLYKKDPFLRNIESKIFDSNIHPAALCEIDMKELINVCLWKWILVYRVLGAKMIIASNQFDLVDN